MFGQELLVERRPPSSATSNSARRTVRGWPAFSTIRSAVLELVTGDGAVQIRAAVPGRRKRPEAVLISTTNRPTSTPRKTNPTGTPTALSSYFARDYYARLRDLTR